MPLLRPLGSRALASASMNPEGATDGQQPDEPGEILTFGKPERRSRLLPGSIRRPAIATVVAGMESSSAAWHWQWLFLPSTTPPPMLR
jgi:hypothetical protein